MAKQFLSDDVIEHIQDGYYATHEQDLTEAQVRELTEEQLHYYNKQGREYRVYQKKQKRTITWILVVMAVVVVVAIGVLFLYSQSGNKLYDPDKKPDTTSDNSADTPGLAPANQSNTRAGAKDDTN